MAKGSSKPADNLFLSSFFFFFSLFSFANLLRFKATIFSVPLCLGTREMNSSKSFIFSSICFALRYSLYFDFASGPIFELIYILNAPYDEFFFLKHINFFILSRMRYLKYFFWGSNEEEGIEKNDKPNQDLLI